MAVTNYLRFKDVNLSESVPSTFQGQKKVNRTSSGNIGAAYPFFVGNKFRGKEERRRKGATDRIEDGVRSPKLAEDKDSSKRRLRRLDKRIR